MKKAGNPFVFGAANDFSPDEVLEYYIEDFNYSRFLNSTRNLFILGERGSGKTMTLLYHKLATQLRAFLFRLAPCSLDYIGVYRCIKGVLHGMDGGRNKFIHSLNASGLATSRLLPAVVEQFQNADGSVNVPAVLRDRVGKSVFEPVG